MGDIGKREWGRYVAVGRFFWSREVGLCRVWVGKEQKTGFPGLEP